jgi:hypothetical protein
LPWLCELHIGFKGVIGINVVIWKKTETVMHSYGAHGWEMNFMVIERHRLLLFWAREAAAITFSQENI